MRRQLRIVLALLLLLAVSGGSMLAAERLLRPAQAYALVDETTLVVLRGPVEVQPRGGSYAAVAGDAVVRVNDRVRTGVDGYAVITFFDGSTTELEPETEIEVQRLERLGAGGKWISLRQELGLTWNRVERLVDAKSRFETTTASSVAFVRGTEYQVRVERGGRTTVETVTDVVVVEAVVDREVRAVTVSAGLSTTVETGRAPSEPVRSTSAGFAVRIDVQGPIRPYLTDDRNRSVGYQPEADVYLSQVPGATYVTEGDRQTIILPDPVEGYTLALKGTDRGAYTVAITGLVGGQEVAEGRSHGLARPLDALERSGVARVGERDGLRVEVDVQHRTLGRVGELQALGGATATGRSAFTRNQLSAAARANQTAVAAPTGGAGTLANAVATPLAPRALSSSGAADGGPATFQVRGIDAETDAPEVETGPVGSDAAASVDAPSIVAPLAASTRGPQPTSRPVPTVPPGMDPGASPTSTLAAVLTASPVVTVTPVDPTSTLVPSTDTLTPLPTETLAPTATVLTVPSATVTAKPTPAAPATVAPASSSPDVSGPVTPSPSPTETTGATASPLRLDGGGQSGRVFTPISTRLTVVTSTASVSSTPALSVTPRPTSTMTPTPLPTGTIRSTTLTPTSSPAISATATATRTATRTLTPTMVPTPTGVQWRVADGGNDHFYSAVAVPSGIDWDTARAQAEARGGYLATITSAAENAFVFALVSGDARFWYAECCGAGEGPWLGGLQPAGSVEPAGGWQWVTGEAFGYTNWSSAEPNNQGGEDRVVFYGETSLMGDRWNDIRSTGLIHGYIVEFGLP